MNLTNNFFIGIDPTSGHKDFSFAVLDDDLNLVELADADMDEMVAFLNQHDSAHVAVNAPTQVNLGLVKKKLEADDPTPGRTFRGVDIRLAEYELRERGITITGTPSQEKFCPAWMRVGFALYAELIKIGFNPYGGSNGPRLYLETHPHACYCVLAEGVPFSKPTLEGRLQRQLILNSRNLRITDGMDFFEEITRFKLIKGILPTDVLYLPEQLDVLVAAYTAWIACNQADEIITIGNLDEGQMVLPVGELKEKY